MPLFARLRSFVRALVGGRRLEREMDEEWRFHVEARADALVAQGVRPDEAARRARDEFGDPLRWKESSREARGITWIYDLIADVRYGLRQLRRAPVFSLAAIATLALGIGANTLAFSILHAVLVRDLPYRDADRIVLVWFLPPNAAAGVRAGSTLQNYFAVRDRSQSFAFVGSMSGASASFALSQDDAAGGEPVIGQRVHATLPPVLGVEPALGTWFSDADDPATAARKVVLGHALWQQRFGSDPGVIGRVVRMDGQEATIVAVMPEGFEFFDGVSQFWMPSRWSQATMESPTRMLVVAARLRPEVTLQQAQAEMDVLAAALARELPKTNADWRIQLEPIYDAYTSGTRRPLLLLQGVVALVLLIACANVAGLLLAQASTRQQEFGLRLALGSSRGRLARQLFAESLLLAGIGGACGIALAMAGLRVFMAQNPTTWLPRASGITLDQRVLLFAVLVTAFSCFLFGLLPFWTASRAALIPAIKRANVIGSVSHQHLRSALVTGQVAVALALLIASGLLVNSLVRLNLNRPAIDATNLLTFKVRLPLDEMTTPTGRDAQGFFTLTFSPRVSETFSGIQDRLAAVPGVQAVSVAMVPPATEPPFRFRVTAPGQQEAGGDVEPAAWFPVGTDYFRTLGIAVSRGREFERRDSLSATPVAIINETLARRLWPNDDPIGRQITIDFVNDRPRQVVGVAPDLRETSRQRTFAPHVFVPEAQLPLASRGYFQSPRITMTYVVRSAGRPAGLVGALRSAVAEVYRNQPIYDIKTMDQVMATQIAAWRQYLLLLGGFAGIAALLTVVGVYGLVAYSVGQRSQEIGVRRALGADTGDVLRLVLGQGIVRVGLGVALGIAGSLAATRILRGLLWEVSPTDPLTFALVTVGFGSVALLACYVPARRALSVSPIVALRVD